MPQYFWIKLSEKVIETETIEAARDGPEGRFSETARNVDAQPLRNRPVILAALLCRSAERRRVSPPQHAILIGGAPEEAPRRTSATAKRSDLLISFWRRAGGAARRLRRSGRRRDPVRGRRLETGTGNNDHRAFRRR